MKRMVCVVLVVVSGRSIALSAQPVLTPAVKGEIVRVHTCDGSDIEGTIAEWVDDVGFRLIPKQGPAYMIRLANVESIRDAGTNEPRGVPARAESHFGKGVLVGVLSAIGAIVGLGVAIGLSSGHR